jgi:hypothetical protein
MPAVKFLNEVADPTWEQIVSAVNELRSDSGDKGYTLTVDDENVLIVYHTTQGYLVSGSELGDTDYYVLTDPSLGEQHVTVWCAGTDMDRPRKVFVSDSLALQSLKHYFETGRRNPALQWEIDSKCW